MPTEPETFTEIGATGLKRYGGTVDEEFLVELRGPRGIKVYREMGDNDSIVGAILYAIQMLIRRTDWYAIPGGTSPADAEAADFLASNLDDMSSSWDEFITEALSYLQYGWSYHEVVYKRRNGDSGDVVSKYDDGRIGWRKIPIRSQDSLTSWVFDDEGGIEAMTQSAPPDFATATIPISKAALFRTTTAKNNPEGRSLLRSAYRDWYFKRTIEEVEAIGIERDLAGLPVAGVPASWFTDKATANQRAALEDWEKTVRDIRRDSMDGLVKPLEYDDNGNSLYTLELLSTGGTRQIDVNQTIERKNVGIATSVLADFILIGHEKVGSFALAVTKKDLFSVALTGFLEMMKEVLNRHVVSKLFQLNDFAIDVPPELAYGAIEQVDLKELGEYLSALAGLGYPLFPNEALERKLLAVADLPEPNPEERDAAMFDDGTDDGSGNDDDDDLDDESGE